MHSHSLDPTSQTARLNWAHDHVKWTDNDWDPILFTDEWRCCLDFTDRHARVWRRSGERFQDANISEHDRYGGGSIMVWAGISRGGRTDLNNTRGMMTRVRYRNDILDIYVRPTLVQSDPSSSSWMTMLDLIMPGWLRSTSSRIPSPVWTGQHARLISTSSCQGGWGVPPTGNHRPYGLASTLTWSQPDRACLEHATGSDFATSGPANNSRWTGKCPHWRVGQCWDDSNPETHWKLETALPGCDCISWVTHLSYWQSLILVFELFLTFSWPGVTLWNLHFGVSVTLMTECVLSIVQIWYTTMKFMK